MDFGKTDNLDQVNFALPSDHPGTADILKKSDRKGKLVVYTGCAKWGKKDLKTFYPRGTKDELAYYSQQFNSIELNATFYGRTTLTQVETWRDKTPEDFKFFPKIPQLISHIKRINDIDGPLEEYCDAISGFSTKLGSVFLQLPDNFSPKYIDRIENFIKIFPKEIELSLELRNTEFFNNEEISQKLYEILEENNINNILTDTAGRRDLLHMRLTTPQAFIRYVGANHPSDYTRIDVWIERIKTWADQGLQEVYFFVHQNVEEESPLLTAYFIEKINKALSLDLKRPTVPNEAALKE